MFLLTDEGQSAVGMAVRTHASHTGKGIMEQLTSEAGHRLKLVYPQINRFLVVVAKSHSAMENVTKQAWRWENMYELDTRVNHFYN